MAQLNKVVSPIPAPRHLPRLPSRKEMLIAMIALIIAAVLALGGRIAYSALTSRGNTAPVIPQQPVVVPAKPEVPAVSNPQVPQNVQENVGAAAPVVVDYRVVWTEVQGFDPSTIPVEEGFYSGVSEYNLYPNVAGPSSPARAPYAWKILPRLEGLPVAVAATRNENIVFVALDADRYGPYILLSVDGEKSWYKLNLLWEGIPYGDTSHVRVMSNGDEIRLYALEPRPGIHWRTATIKKSELPH